MCLPPLPHHPPQSISKYVQLLSIFVYFSASFPPLCATTLSSLSLLFRPAGSSHSKSFQYSVTVPKSLHELPGGKAEFPSRILTWIAFGKYYCCWTSAPCWASKQLTFPPPSLINSLCFSLFLRATWNLCFNYLHTVPVMHSPGFLGSSSFSPSSSLPVLPRRAPDISSPFCGCLGRFDTEGPKGSPSLITHLSLTCRVPDCLNPDHFSPL